MEYKLVFKLTLYDGSTVEQSYDCPPDPAKVQAAINQLLAVYMQAGYVKGSENGLCAKRVNQVDIEVPSIILAKPGDVPKPPQGGKITLT
jgi:hypothetical protein